MNNVINLVADYDLIIFDLDGVLYIGNQVVPGAASAVSQLQQHGTDVVYATNNASRSAEAVADLLSSLGIPAKANEVVTSAQAAATLVAERFAPGSPILVVGASALVDEVRGVGLRPVSTADAKPVAVVQGYGPEVGWSALAEASVAIRAGATWVATNVDRTLPSPRGPLPGNGALVAALATALDREPDAAVGKPGPLLFQRALSSGAVKPLVIGDRLDTDIEGAHGAGMDSLLVLTGVSTPAEVLAAVPHQRPTFILRDLEGLFAPQRPVVDADGAGWLATVDGGTLRLEGTGTPMDALRAMCTAWWSAEGTGGKSDSGLGPTIVAKDSSVAEILAQLDL